MSHGLREHLAIDRDSSRRRIADDVGTLAQPQFTSSPTAICRYAYTPEYQRTIDWFRAQFDALGFTVWQDPLGTLVAQNRPAGSPVFGMGSHCDSNRNGGPWDGTLGVVVALEVCRLAAEANLDLPLRVISFLEEEGSGFGQLLLGSRACGHRLTEAQLRTEFTALDDGRTLWEHARAAGHAPERWRECAAVLDDLTGWIECHIEQGRVLQDAGETVGLVTGIAGYVHADIELHGRADHAGATPMGHRIDAMAAAAEITLELERLVCVAGTGTVGVVGELDLEPGLINVIPGRARLSLDIRGIDETAYREVAHIIEQFAQGVAARRGAKARYTERQSAAPVRLDETTVDALQTAARHSGVAHRRMVSGAAHDTAIVAERAPSAMVFVPCRDGISHAPQESADPADAAVAAEMILNAIMQLSER
jgi:allantoate deiminase